MKKVLVSACLLGERVRYDGRDKRVASDVLARWVEEGRVVPLCPEVEGGLAVPRSPAELQADGRVRTERGADVTAEFSRGAAAALAEARRHGVALAVLKEGSPSCGTREIYDGTFSKQRVRGEGMTAKALRLAGVPVYSELELDDADEYLRGQD